MNRILLRTRALCSLPGLAAILGGLLASNTARAQSTVAPAGAPDAQVAPVTSATPAAPAASAAPPLVPAAPARSAAPAPLEARVAAQQAQIDALVTQSKDQERSVAALRAQVSSASDEAPTKILSFWGFSDLTFGGMHYDSSSALYKVATPYRATFYSGGINLYAKSEMTRTLSAMVETQLTYTPNGAIPGDDYPSKAYVGSTLVQSGAGTPAANTTVHGPYSQLSYRQDGLVIERAYMEWKPTDWFALRAGRFLTPFGIWNEDHGSPVLIGVDYPQFMNFNLVPLQQLGLEAFGSVGLGDDLRMEYALTFANSNGPSDEFKDMTDMKALGARLKVVYSHDDLYVRLGGYAYYNQYVDTTDTLAIHLTPKLTLDTSVASPGSDVTTTNQSSDQVIVTGDLDIRYKKLRLMAEFANQSVIYNTPPTLGSISQLLKSIPLNVTAYDASHYGYGWYVMGAYEMPFHTKLLDFSVMPYVGYDYVIPSTVVLQEQTQQVRGGLNFKPSPFVTVKAEVSRVLPQSPVVDSKGTAVFGQVAFSF